MALRKPHLIVSIQIIGFNKSPRGAPKVWRRRLCQGLPNSHFFVKWKSEMIIRQQNGLLCSHQLAQHPTSDLMTRTDRPVTSLGHQKGRRVFREGPKFFKLCLKFFNYVQHIFPGGAKKFLGGLRSPCAPLVTGLRTEHVLWKWWRWRASRKIRCEQAEREAVAS